MPKRKFTFISARHEKSSASKDTADGYGISCTITQRISKHEWARYHDVIRQKYIDDGWILDDVLEYLRVAEGFRPSKHQLSLQLGKWGFVKKNSHLRKASQTALPRKQDGSRSSNSDWRFARNPSESFPTHDEPRLIRPKNSTGNFSNTTTLVSSAASIYHKSAALEKLAAIEDYNDQPFNAMSSHQVDHFPSVGTPIEEDDDWAIKLSEELDRTRLSFDFANDTTSQDLRSDGQIQEMELSTIPTLARSLSSSTLSDYAEFRAMKRRLENPVREKETDLVQNALVSLERLSLDHIFRQSHDINTRPSTTSSKSASTASWTDEFFGADIWQ